MPLTVFVVSFLVWTFVLVAFLLDRVPRTLRAALEQANRDGRR